MTRTRGCAGSCALVARQPPRKAARCHARRRGFQWDSRQPGMAYYMGLVQATVVEVESNRVKSKEFSSKE